MVENQEYWIYIPNFIEKCKTNEINFMKTYDDILPFVKEYDVNISMLGKTYPSRRISCVFKNNVNEISGVEDKRNTSKLFSYGKLPNYDWVEAPLILHEIKKIIENYCGIVFDYCLVHIYRDGNDKIDKHSDKEALNSCVVSFSLGESRIFRFQRNGLTSGWEKEYILNGGDLLIMKAGCQQIYHHWVPEQKRITKPRINFTFRKNDDIHY